MGVLFCFIEFYLTWVCYFLMSWFSFIYFSLRYFRNKARFFPVLPISDARWFHHRSIIFHVLLNSGGIFQVLHNYLFFATGKCIMKEIIKSIKISCFSSNFLQEVLASFEVSWLKKIMIIPNVFILYHFYLIYYSCYMAFYFLPYLPFTHSFIHILVHYKHFIIINVFFFIP